MRQFLIFSLATALVFGLAGAVYASPLNQWVSYELDELINTTFGEKEMDPCLLEGHEENGQTGHIPSN